jgi:phage/conjugal plasmid C-4 type zinc finger TraR family protein
MDNFDRAQAIELAAWEALQDEAARGHVAAPGEYFCEDCGEEIPRARREAAPSCTRCLECQTDHESLKRRGLA